AIVVVRRPPAPPAPPRPPAAAQVPAPMPTPAPAPSPAAGFGPPPRMGTTVGADRPARSLRRGRVLTVAATALAVAGLTVAGTLAWQAGNGRDRKRGEEGGGAWTRARSEA